jgi:hypothetical protein
MNPLTANVQGRQIHWQKAGQWQLGAGVGQEVNARVNGHEGPS